MTSPEDDVLIRALRALPQPPTAPADQARTGAAARAAFARAFEPRSRAARWLEPLGRVAVPAGLACVCALYLLWAFSAAAALTR
jgi:hypothetical protein